MAARQWLTQTPVQAAPHKCVAPVGPINGTAATFNYLIDTILAIPDTRAMYLRRLRTLMDQLTGGQLAGVSVNALIRCVHGFKDCLGRLASVSPLTCCSSGAMAYGAACSLNRDTAGEM